jgi:hypothetical protein
MDFKVNIVLNSDLVANENAHFIRRDVLGSIIDTCP